MDYLLYSYSEEAGFEEVARIPMQNGYDSYFYDLRGLFLGGYFYLASSNGVQVYGGEFEILANLTF